MGVVPRARVSFFCYAGKGAHAAGSSGFVGGRREGWVVLRATGRGLEGWGGVVTAHALDLQRASQTVPADIYL